MKENNKVIFSIISKMLVFVCATVGVILNILFGNFKGATCLLYFTTQSNVWIGVFDLILAVFLILSIKKENKQVHPYLIKMHQVFTTCIAITGIVYCFILMPGYYASKGEALEGFSPFNAPSVMLHIVVPVLSLVDFFLFTRNFQFKKIDILWSIIPMAYYFIFSILGFNLKWDFGKGNNFPYFFLNFGSPAGIFGFSDEMPYFMGSFYWILIVLGIAIGVSSLLIFITNKINKKTSCD